ncbi:MAG TPA: hypothetical protein VF447_07995 [Terriglobales bacterium]
MTQHGNYLRRGNVKRELLNKSCLGLFTALLLIALLGCNSSSSSKASASTDSDTSSGDSGTQLDVMCIGDRINNPPEPFHYSYKYSDASMSVVQDADITPQAMEITVTDGSGTHKYHGVRSDEDNWGSAVLSLSSLNNAAMAARLSSLNGTSSLTSKGPENINGYSTTKYAIDTTSANAKDKNTYHALFGNSYAQGTLWAPADGCAVKLVLDEGLQQQDGSIKKVHYEMARIKK